MLNNQIVCHSYTYSIKNEYSMNKAASTIKCHNVTYFCVTVKVHMEFTSSNAAMV